MNGQIIKVISNDYTVKLENNKKIVCKARGVFRNKNITPLAGDYCFVDEKNKLITEIFDRKNSLNRPPVSNIDAALILMSTINPDFSITLLDKMITIIEYNNIEPVIVISKTDLLFNDEIKAVIDYFKNIGYKVFLNSEVEDNKIDSSLNLKTDEISKALGRGKHTTRAVTFYEIGTSLIADTPGFSALSFIDMSKENIRDCFNEFNTYRDRCKYRDCMHIKEDECEIKRLVSEGKINKDRYNDYIDFIKEKENEGISFNIKGKK